MFVRDSFEWKILIGFEIHVTLKSVKKIFNPEYRFFDNNKQYNKFVGSWELGYPGVLPSLNPEVIRLALKFAIFSKMKINRTLFFDRKIYDYYDLSKGYQITQKRKVLAENGFVHILNKENKFVSIPIKSIHLEEDTAKSFYQNNEVLLDFNRSGNPLMEVVTDPIFFDIEDSIIFLRNLQFLLRFLEISDCNMEKAEFRIDVNFSFFRGSSKSPRFEIKNLNSFKSIKIILQKSLEDWNLEVGIFREHKIFENKTLQFDFNSNILSEKRIKEKYFFIPEFNIPPIYLEENELIKIEKTNLSSPWEIWKKISFLNKEEHNSHDFFFDNVIVFRIIVKLAKIEAIKKIEDWIPFFTFFGKFFNNEKFDIELFKKKKEDFFLLKDIWEKKRLNFKIIFKELNFLIDKKEYYLGSEDIFLKKFEEIIFSEDDLGVIRKNIESFYENNIQIAEFNKDSFKNFLLGKLKRKYPLNSQVLSLVDNFLKERK